MWVVLLVMLLSVPTGTHAARFLTTGFEENDLASTIWSSAGAGASIVTTAPHFGTYHVSLSGTSAKTLVWNRSTSVTSGTFWTGFYWRTSNIAAVTSEFFRIRNSGGGAAVILKKNTDGTITLTNNVTASAQTTTFAVSVDTWYRIEVEYVAADSGGSMTLRLYVGDSETITDTVTITGEDTLNTNVREWIWIENTNNASTTYYIDDVMINDDSGSFQTDWTGPGSIVTLTPNGDTSVAWTKGGTPEATNYGGVDDVPGTPNDATDYNYDTSTTNEDKFALTDMPAGVDASDTMVLAAAYSRAALGVGGSASYAMKIWNESGTGTAGPTISLGGTSWRILTQAEQQVYDLSGKTKANLDSFSAGYVAVAGTTEKRVTAVWVNVQTKAAAASSGPCTFMLLGAGPC